MSYEVRNTEVEIILEKIGKLLKRSMPRGWGFTVLLFDYSKPGKDASQLFYLSSAPKADTIKTMIQFVEQQLMSDHAN